MPRPLTLIHPQRASAALRPAATVLLLRDTPSGLEVLMTRRSNTASFAPGAFVFPGGGIDAADASPEAFALSSRRSTQSDLQLTQALAAIRESFEELGILLAQDSAGQWLDPGTLARDQPFYPQIAAVSAHLMGAGMHIFAHWITDRDMPRRFDVPFLVARMPPGQTPVADESEQFEPVWVHAAQALERHAAGQFFMIFPTIRTLQRLQAFATVDDVLAACHSEQPLFSSCPRAGTLSGAEARYMAHEQPFGELELVSPDGQIVHELAWQSEQPVHLLRHVARLTAPNASFMTGPGTNSYLLGTPQGGFVVVDPGPALEVHVQRLWAAAQGRIHAIVCTHSHADHSPGAPLLQALCERNGAARPPIFGLPSAPTSKANAQFTPDIVFPGPQGDALVLQLPLGRAATTAPQAPSSTAQPERAHDADQFLLYKIEQTNTTGTGHTANLSGFSHISAGLAPSALVFSPWAGFDGPTLTVTLRALRTPGHAANHLCLVMEEDGLLLSGDHILNGSTTVIDPPDGHMGQYLDSLDALAQACQRHDVLHILPAHGYVLGSTDEPAGVQIARLKAHRLAREAKVAAAMTQIAHGGLEDWLPLAYADTDARLWPVARRSLAAHVEHLQGVPPVNGALGQRAGA